MGQTLTDKAQAALTSGDIRLQLVAQFDGVDTLFGVQTIQAAIKVGDPGLKVGGGWKVGGLGAVPNQQSLITYQSGATTSIRTQLTPDKGQGTQNQPFQLTLIDAEEIITQLISPGFEVDDLLGQRARVYAGMQGTSFPEDFTVLSRGFVRDISAAQGTVTLTIAPTDALKKQKLFSDLSLTLAGDVDASINAIALSAVPGFDIENSSAASSMKIYAKIDDEYMLLVPSYGSGGSVNILVTRAQLDSVAATHTAGSDVKFVYRLTGNVMDLALGILLSTQLDDDLDPTRIAYVSATSINYVSPTETVPHSAWFAGIDLVSIYGTAVGDRVPVRYTLGGATFPPYGTDNPGGVFVASVDRRVDGTLVTFAGPDGTPWPFNTETTTGAQFTFPVFNAFPTLGLGLKLDEVDVDKHLSIRDRYLADFNIDLFITDEIDGRELIETQFYMPAGCCSNLRNAQASVTIAAPPLPDENLITLDSSNVTNAKDLKVSRGITKNFYNEINYFYDKNLEDDNYAQFTEAFSATSYARIKVGSTSLTIQADGLREAMGGEALAQKAAERRLERYAFAAETIDSVNVLFSTGFSMAIGDIVAVDTKSLGLIDSKKGTRRGDVKLYEVQGWNLNLQNGEVELTLLDTFFSTSSRYGLISPASIVSAGVSPTQFTIQPSFNAKNGADEYKKWTPLVTLSDQVAIKVKSPDGTTRFGQAKIQSLSGNVVNLQSSLGFTPMAGDIVEIANYDYPGQTARAKLLFAFYNQTTFADGKSFYTLF